MRTELSRTNPGKHFTDFVSNSYFYNYFDNALIRELSLWHLTQKKHSIESSQKLSFSRLYYSRFETSSESKTSLNFKKEPRKTASKRENWKRKFRSSNRVLHTYFSSFVSFRHSSECSTLSIHTLHRITLLTLNIISSHYIAASVTLFERKLHFFFA